MAQLNALILSCLIFCPVAGALLVAVLPRDAAKWGALAVAAFNFVLSLHLVANWGEVSSALLGGTGAGKDFHFQEMREWLPQLGVSYHLGVDGISVLLVLLTTFLTPLVMLASWRAVTQRSKEFVVCLLLLEAAAVGVFCALDVILFYVFWEAVLIPTYILIVGWGGARRAAAGIKFFLYTMAGSVLMWAAMLYLYFMQPVGARSFGYAAIGDAARALEGSNGAVALWLFAAFALAFAIKAPVFPLHSWLPDAYTQAPTAATVMLAAVLSKMGIYGFLRFAIPFFPETARGLAPIFIALSIIGVIYGALVATAQTDIKKLLAYSSISHVALIVLGVFAALLATRDAALATTGATLQMVNHGLSTGALFLLAGLLLERRRDETREDEAREIHRYGGLAQLMPRFTVLFWVALFASIGLPGLNGFIGEYLILQGAMNAGFWYAAGGATGVILGAIYMLRMFRTLMFGETREAAADGPNAHAMTAPETTISGAEVRGPEAPETDAPSMVLPETTTATDTMPTRSAAWRDVTPRETFVLAAVLAVIVWIGVAPQSFLNIIKPDANTGAAATALAPRNDTNQLAQR